MAYIKGFARNILVGAAAVFLSADDSTVWAEDPVTGVVDYPELPAGTETGEPAKSFTEVLAADENWVNAGYTTDGVEVQYSPDFGEVPVDQLLDSAKLFKQGQTVSVNTTLQEATLRNLMIAWGQQGASLKSGAGSGWDGRTLLAGEEHLAIDPGELGDDPVERSIAFVGPGPNVTTGTSPSYVVKQSERVYHVRRALQTEQSTHGLKRSENTGIPVSFRCLPDGASGRAGYGSVLQRVITVA